MSAVSELKTRSGQVKVSGTHPQVSLRLGGTTLWAATPEILERGVTELQATIEEIAASYLTVAKVVLNKLVRERLELAAIEDRVFSAVLGASLRAGRLDSLVCSSKNDKPFWVYMHTSRLQQWDAATVLATTMIRERGTLTVRALEERVFGVRAYNTWSSTFHVLAQLSHRGTVRMIAGDTFAVVQNLI